MGTATGATMKLSASAKLKQNHLPDIVRQAHIYPDLAYKSLLLAGKFCDAGYAAVFLKDRVQHINSIFMSMAQQNQE